MYITSVIRSPSNFLNMIIMKTKTIVLFINSITSVGWKACHVDTVKIMYVLVPLLLMHKKFFSLELIF